MPGRIAIRKELRRPYPTIRRVFGSELEKLGLPGAAAPESGSMRIRAPFRPVGSPDVRTSWRAQPPALGGRRGHRPAHAAGRVAAGVQGLALLAVVGEVPGGPVAARVVQVAVGAEVEPPADVARVLEAARDRDQHLLGAAGDLSGDLEARDATADHAPVLVAPGPVRRVRASVGGLAGDAPRRRRAAGRGVVRVEEVDVGVGGEIRVYGKAEQAPVPVVVDLGPQVGDLRRRRVGGVLVRLHDAALLRHEHTPVGSELDRGGGIEPREGDRLLEAGWERHGRGPRSQTWEGGQAQQSSGAGKQRAHSERRRTRAIESKSVSGQMSSGSNPPSLEERSSANPATVQSSTNASARIRTEAGERNLGDENALAREDRVAGRVDVAVGAAVEHLDRPQCPDRACALLHHAGQHRVECGGHRADGSGAEAQSPGCRER